MLYPLLMPHQKRAVEHLLKNRKLGLFYDQGTGKTWCAGGAIEKLQPEECLVVVPLTSLENTWRKFFAERLPGIQVTSSFEEYKSLSGPKVLLVHYEGFVALIKKLLRRKWVLVIFDESQRLMNRGTKQSRSAGRLHEVEYRLIMSGTPLEQSLKDLWGQFRFLVPGLLGTWSEFKDKWLKPTGYMGYKLEFRKEKTAEFLALVSPYCLRVELRDVTNVPEPEVIIVPLRMMGHQRRVYEEMEEDTTLGISVDLEITRVAKLRQIPGGFIKDNDGNDIYVGNAKLTKLKHLVRKLDKPVVVFCAFTSEIEAVKDWMEAEGYSVGVINGKIKDTKRIKARSNVIEAFQRGEYEILVCQCKVGSVSLNLQRASNVVIYSMSYSYIDYSQIKSRVDRMGQEKQSRIYVLQAENSIDIPITEAILLKQDVTQAVTKYLRKRNRQTWQRN